MNFLLSVRDHRSVRGLVPYAALLGSILALTSGTSFAKQLFPLVGAEATAGYRVGFSALVLLLVWRPWRIRLPLRDLLAIMRYGSVLGLMNLCFYLALRTIPLGLAIAIEFIGPLTLALVLSRRAVHVAMVGIAVAGLALLLPGGTSSSALDATGVGFALAAALFWALYIVFGKRTGHLHGGHAVSLGMTMAALIVVPIGIHAAGTGFFDPHMMLIGLVAAILSSAIPYSLEMVALKRIPSRNFGVLLSIEPAVGALAGMLFLGELLAPLQWLAILLVVTASAVTIAAGTSAGPVEPTEAIR